jgi:Tol biopolymer transport system component
LATAGDPHPPDGRPADQLLVTLSAIHPRWTILARRHSGEPAFGAPVWSKDCRRVAYEERSDKNNPRVCVVETRRRRERCVRTGTSGNSTNGFDPSPDGTRVAFGDVASLRILDVGIGRVATILRPDTQSIARELRRRRLGTIVSVRTTSWSPSGKYVAAVVDVMGPSRSVEMSLILRPDGSLVALLRPSGAELTAAFGWSPSSVYAYAWGKSMTQGVTEILSYDPRTHKRARVYRGDIGALKWSPSGRWFALFSRDQASGVATIRIVDTRGREPTRVARLEARSLIGWGP